MLLGDRVLLDGRKTSPSSRRNVERFVPSVKTVTRNGSSGSRRRVVFPVQDDTGTAHGEKIIGYLKDQSEFMEERRLNGKIICYLKKDQSEIVEA